MATEAAVEEGAQRRPAWAQARRRKRRLGSPRFLPQVWAFPTHGPSLSGAFNTQQIRVIPHRCRTASGVERPRRRTPRRGTGYHAALPTVEPRSSAGNVHFPFSPSIFAVLIVTHNGGSSVSAPQSPPPVTTPSQPRNWVRRFRRCLALPR